ncbi:prepilin-type N-terminal cleavage/methylation domain-containing protein [Candidatus Roizmanbacteria bacterium]|nr:prepilin-type N-terminal cleavage/methylation domain-containing protein [Candidatus Roizmanbacteria bacterium]
MKRGFTLIELLVVIAVVGLLSGLLVPNFMAARQRARDGQRKSDLRQIQKALELYRQDPASPVFPAALPACNSPLTNTVNGTTITYMSKVPCDPLNTVTKYYYSADNTTLTYTLSACLENTADADGVVCPGGITCTNKCYTVNEP